jgi:deoxyribonuclease V
MHPSLEPWPTTVADAKALQLRLADQVSQEPLTGEVEWIAGADVHYPEKNSAYAAAVLLRWPDLTVADVQIVEEPAPFPYVPGLLSFREAPSVVKAVNALKRQPDLVLVDGQGMAHPRHFGAACHIGVLLDLPTIGCAKSRLWGMADEPSQEQGDWKPILDESGVIGALLRSRPRVKPLYVSVGHRVSLDDAVRWVLATCKGYRLPEPSRLAHRAAGRNRIPLPV